MSKTRDIGGCRDLISGLPDSIIGNILSFLPTKEAASTSLLSTKWRYLFALVTNLDLDESVYLNPREEEKIPVIIDNAIVMVHPDKKSVSTSFMDFVDRVLALQGNSHVHKFSLKIKDGEEIADAVDPNRIFSWILNVLQRSVSELSLHLLLESEIPIDSKMFLSKTLVKLTLMLGMGPLMDFEHVDLPKLKTLCFQSVHFEKHGIGLTKFLSGCPMLEDLVLDDISWFLWESASVSVSTLKRLKFCWSERGDTPKSVSFDTPNLVYLEFTDTIAEKYQKVNFNSLVEAKINLRLTYVQTYYAYAEGNEENDMVANAADFIVGLCNVKILHLSAYTLEVFNYCCEAIPLFNNLTHLTIESNPAVGWKSLLGLLKNSPNLETLVLLGLAHKYTDECGDVCLCKPYHDDYCWVDEEEEIHTCLLSSPVKVLKIMRFGGIFEDEKEKMCKQIKNQFAQVEHFLEMMPNLEQLVVYCEPSFNVDVMIEVSTLLQRISKVASRKCNLQLISDHISLSSIVPASFLPMKWSSLS